MMVGSDVLPPAEATVSPGNRSHHAHPVLPRLEVVIHVRGELEPIEMPTNKPIGVVLRIPREYLSVASASAIVL